MAAVTTYHHLIVLRLIVGVLEAGFAPGILLILSSWYKKNEQSKRFAVYISAAVLSGAFGGILAGAITGGLDGAHGIRGWRWLFIVEGVATIVSSRMSFFYKHGSLLTLNRAGLSSHTSFCSISPQLPRNSVPENER